MIDNSFCLRSIMTVAPLLFPLLRHNPLVTLYKPLHIGNFYPRHMIAWMCYSATVGYCFLLAQKYKIFSLVLTSWFVIVAFKTSRNPHTPAKYVAHYWLRLVRSINSSTSNWFTPSSIGNYVTWIIASSFLENSISFMSLVFDGCYFVATFHCNFSYGYLLYVVTLINAS